MYASVSCILLLALATVNSFESQPEAFRIRTPRTELPLRCRSRCIPVRSPPGKIAVQCLHLCTPEFPVSKNHLGPDGRPMIPPARLEGPVVCEGRCIPRQMRFGSDNFEVECKHYCRPQFSPFRPRFGPEDIIPARKGLPVPASRRCPIIIEIFPPLQRPF